MNNVKVTFGARTFETPADGRSIQQILDEARGSLRFGSSVRIVYNGQAVSSPTQVTPEGGSTISVLTQANQKAAR